MGELIMFYDTETTDKWDFKGDWAADHQPNLVQLGFKVMTRKKEVVHEVGLNVNTTTLPSWNGIAPEAEAVHGISEDLLKKYGLGPIVVAGEFTYWASMCRLFVAHNEDFDNKIVRCFLKRVGFNPGFTGSSQVFCTMKSTTNLCKIPNAKGYGYKWPKLPEAYCALVDKAGFKNAHNALADVNPCSEIFWQLVKSEFINLDNLMGAANG